MAKACSAGLPLMLHHPRPPRYDSSAALAHLSAADRSLGSLIRCAGPFTLMVSSRSSPFEALLRSIVYQQLHGKAAEAIHSRLLHSFAPTCGSAHPSAQHFIDCPNEQLRLAGLSHNKALSIRDLAAKTLDGTVSPLERMRRLPDEAIIGELTHVRGIGRWTVEMFLIFRLGRPDVFPTSDYGVRKGFALTFEKLKIGDKVKPADLPTEAVMHKRAARWHPWCTVASWYLWRACDLKS